MNKLHLLSLAAFLFLFSSCKEQFELEEYIGEKNYTLLDQDSLSVQFPSNYKGKNLLLGFIFTNCPDICPITANKLKLVQEECEKEGIDEIEFALVSFDPERDPPSKLKQFVSVRGLDESNYKVYTGEKVTIHSLLKRMSITAIPEDSVIMDDGELSYYFTHSDRLFLIDKENKIRSIFLGSKTDTKLIMEDLHKL